MSESERNGSVKGAEREDSDESRIADLYGSFSRNNKRKGTGAAVNHSTLSVWAGIFLLAVMLALGFHQMRDWVRGVDEQLDQVSQDNKLVLEGMDELLARADRLDQAAESEPSPQAQPAQKTPEAEKPAERDISRRYKIYYRTKDGENLARVSEKFGVSEDQLCIWNAIAPTDPLIPGQVLVINKSTRPAEPTEVARAAPRPEDVPIVAKAEEPAAEEAGYFEPSSDRVSQTEPVEEEKAVEAAEVDERPAPRSESDTAAVVTKERDVGHAESALDEPPDEFPDEPMEGIVHTVQAGETLSEIGQEYGVPWQILAAYNRISDPDTLDKGQKLKISTDPSRTALEPLEEISHTVRAGENLYRIGLKYGVTWEMIARENKMRNGGVLFAGQVLKIPLAKGGPER
jgi:LysM repeat protein